MTTPTQADFKTVEREPDYEREAKESEAERQYAVSVMNREIHWRGYEESKFLTRRELGLILDYDKEQPEQQADLLTEKGADYAQFFIHALETITAKETVEYILTLLEQLLHADPSRASYFHQIASTSQVNIYAPFLRILTANQQGYSSYAQGKAAHVLAILLASAPNPRTPALTQYLRFLITKINKSMHRELTVALTALKELLKRAEIQIIFKDEDGVNSLSQLLSRETQNTQLIYQVGFCIWLISYNPEVAPSIQESGIIRKLAMILKTATVEKVVRIALATLKNLIQLNDDAYAKEMIGLGLVKVLDTLSKRKWKDQDIVKDVDYISNNLQDTIRQLSSFEMYEAEVQSGNLQWSPVHKNELFWRENISLFDDRIVSILISKLDDPKSEDIVREVACYDVGEFARFHPDGKRIVQRLNGKSRLMGNLTHSNPKVAKQALLAIQKIMVNNWESFNKSSTAGIASITSQSQKKN